MFIEYTNTIDFFFLHLSSILQSYWAHFEVFLKIS